MRYNIQNRRLENIHRIHCHSTHSHQAGPLAQSETPVKISLKSPEQRNLYLNMFYEALPSLRKLLVYATEQNQTKMRTDYLILVSLWVLNGLHAEGHDHQRRRRRKIFNHIHQARLHGHSLHFTPAEWLIGRL